MPLDEVYCPRCGTKGTKTRIRGDVAVIKCKCDGGDPMEVPVIWRRGVPYIEW